MMIQAMQDAGIDPPATLIDDGKLHRYAGPQDKSGNKKNWYVLYPADDNGFQAGAFGRWQGASNGAIKWCSKTTRDFTPEEKAAYKRRQADLQRKQAEDRKQAAEECAEKCKTLWARAVPAADDHSYLKRKQVEAFGIRQLDDMLLVPIRKLTGEIRGLQFIKPDGSKVFKTGVDYSGAVHMIGKPVDNTLIICEGYATGASIHIATGHAVLVAFVAGNLKAVAEATRAKQPEWNIVVAGDDDRWAKEFDESGTTVIAWHEVPCELNGGKRVNTGEIKSRDAALSVKGEVRLPRFSDMSSHPTDFNDLHVLDGLDAVRRAIFPPPVAEYRPPPTDDDYIPQPPDLDEYTDHPLNNAPFQLLGYDHDEYFYLANGTGQVKALTAGSHNKQHFLTLAPLIWWEQTFPSKRGFDEEAARNCLLQTNHGRGIYDPSRVRGLGAWEDNNRSVLHLGDKLLVDGKEVPLQDFRSHYIYERAISISDEKTAPLPAKDAFRLIQLCEMLSWEKSINGRLLAGWCVAAIICGALKWRPHLWLTGPSGSGKTWIVDNIIKHVIGRHMLGMLGTTTEAGLRNALKNDAFSVFFDEFEAEDKNAAARIQSILEFARPASNNEGSKIYKAKSGGGGVNSYAPRSCIGMSSINVNMNQKADLSRVTVLSLVQGEDTQFKNVIRPFWQDNITNAFCRGLRSRVILQIPQINANVEPFRNAIMELMGSRRYGDQYGTILACAYALCRSDQATLEQAREFVGRNDWEGHTATDEQADEHQCLSAIMAGIVRHDNGEKSLGELIVEAETAINPELAKQTLLRHGIKHTPGWFVVANAHQSIKKILEGTPWLFNWTRILSRLPRAEKSGVTRFVGTTSRGVALPVEYVMDDV